MQIIRGIIVSGFSISLMACGGGGGSSNPTSATRENAPPSSETTKTPADGIWTGNTTNPDLEISVLTIGLVDKNGKAYFATPMGVAFGNINTETPLKAYYVDSTATVNWSLTNLNVADNETLELTLESIQDGLPVRNVVTLDYENLYDGSGSLGRVEGIWGDSANGITTVLVINQNGEIEGFDSTGCVLEGQVSEKDTSKNLFNFSLSTFNCNSFASTYSGFMASADSMSGNAEIIMIGVSTDGTELPLVGYFFKQ